ncbi:MAG: nucleotidyltransferase domain-containing protein [Succinivibrionaceae bacterium]
MTSDCCLKDIITILERKVVNKVILFGSHASRINTERSDVDLAVYGGDFDSFYRNIIDSVSWLLYFYIIDVDKNILEKLKWR